ncbi:amidohydrolase family protein [Coraliomargarita sp. SDUM461004]|uniref:Amidohydrolase family protein n=1 Tax=Thalassobacterium sedimentorum TaxID=3041258 RepID=A0ABU1ANB7_9BACT|nr:amidohydrolase family protein [Coraliomargarita sp. SDUM461004]MDQ8196295.1 amidohydrolase family protein [Coraliomargarita sp. SDUM461004]
MIRHHHTSAARLFALTLLLPLAFGALTSASAAEAKAKLLIENATIIPVDGSGRYYESGYVLIDAEGKIASVGAGQAPDSMSAEQAIDATGKIVMPGFLSGHSHLYQSPFRGIGAHHNLMGWIYCYHRTYGPHYDASDLYWFSKHGAMDYLGHGITTIYDWTLNAGGNTVDEYVDLYRGSLDSGARIIFGYGVDLDKSAEENHSMLERYLEIIKEEGIDASHPRVPAVWMAGLGLLNGRESTLMEMSLAKEFDLPIQVHYLEDPEPNYTKIQQGLFPVYDEAGVMGANLNFAHFINVTDPILERSGESGTTMVWNPLSNGRLASGLADIPHYEEMGIEVGMGIDGQASADISDPFENMRMGLYATRMKYQDATIMMPLDVLRYHTIGTARVLGIEEQVGSLEVGKWGDLILIDPRSMETSPVINPIEHVVLACSVANLETVFVAGEAVVERGEFTQVDYEETKNEVTRRVALVQTKVDADHAAQDPSVMDQRPIFQGLTEYKDQKHFTEDHEHPTYGKPKEVE